MNAPMHMSKGRVVIALLLTLILSISCQWKEILMDRPNIQEIIASLESENLEEREAAAELLERVEKQGLTKDEGLVALRAAVKKFPPREFEFQDSSADLIRAVAANPREEYIPVVVELFAEYNDHAKGEAMSLLANMEEKEAAIAYMEIIRLHARNGNLPDLRMWPLQYSPRLADIFFPEILDYADIPSFTYDIYFLCLSYLQQGLLIPEEILPYSDQIVRSYRDYEGFLRSSQKTEGIEWMWGDQYQEARNYASLILDLMGYLPSDEVKGNLREAITYHDPRLKSFAIVSLLRLGEDVNKEAVIEVAKFAEMRNHLYNELEKLGYLSLFPADYRNQEAFAESEMVSWLVFPTELGRVPDEIELMKVVEVDTGTTDGFLDYYVFRFRTHDPHWAAKDGWLAGVSGPFLRKDSPSTVAYGSTFSAFEPWESRDPEEHVGNIEEIIQNWKTYQSNQ